MYVCIINDSSYFTFSHLFYDIRKKWIWPKFHVYILKVKLLANSAILNFTFFFQFLLFSLHLAYLTLFCSFPFRIFFDTFLNFHESCFLYIIPIELLPKIRFSFLSYPSFLCAHILLYTLHSSDYYLADLVCLFLRTFSSDYICLFRNFYQDVNLMSPNTKVSSVA